LRRRSGTPRNHGRKGEPHSHKESPCRGSRLRRGRLRSRRCYALRRAGVETHRLRLERWRVKTLEDRPTLLPAKPVTVRYLVTRRAPASLSDTRLPFERHVFTVFV